MSPVLFGDLEISSSFGISEKVNPVFTSSTTICYASGNCINSVDFTSYFESSDDEIDKKTETVVIDKSHGQNFSRFLTAESAITALASYKRDGIIAFSEYNSLAVRIVKWPSAQFIQDSNVLQAGKDIGITSLVFSFDGRYLASLGDLPQYHITIWDWRNAICICSIPNSSPASSLSFNPFNNHQLCTSSPGEELTFWNLKMGRHQNQLLPLKGILIKKQGDLFDGEMSIDGEHISILSHHWTADQKVIVMAESSELHTFSPLTGHVESEIILSKDQNDYAQFSIKNDGYVISRKNSAFLNIFNSDGHFLNDIKVTEGEAIQSFSLSSDCLSALITSVNGCIYTFDLNRNYLYKHLDSRSGNSFIEIFKLTGDFIIADENNVIKLYKAIDKLEIASVQVPGKISKIAASYLTNLLAVGTECGVLRIYDFGDLEGTSPKLVFREKIYNDSITCIAMEEMGFGMVTVSTDGTVFIFKSLKVLGHFSLSTRIHSVCWHSQTSENSDDAQLSVYFLGQDTLGLGHSSMVFKAQIPAIENIVGSGSDNMALSREVLPVTSYRVDENLFSIAVISNHFNAGKECFYGLSADKGLKLYTLPLVRMTREERIAFKDAIPITNIIGEYFDHQKTGGIIKQDKLRDWLYTCGTDGVITIRSLMEPEKTAVVTGHEAVCGGVRDFVFSRDGKLLISTGFDNQLRFWEWKYSTVGKRLANEAIATVDALIGDKSEEIKLVKDALRLVDLPDLQNETEEICKYSFDYSVVSNLKETNINNIEESVKTVLDNKLTDLRDRIKFLIQENETASEIEAIDREEFVIDFEERDRLMVSADEKVRAVREILEQDNLKKRVICKRLKNEFWNSMNVIGQSVVSFNNDALTGNKITVPNYPIRKQTEYEIKMAYRIKLLRRVQVMVSLDGKKFSNKVRESEETEDTEFTEKNEIESGKIKIQKLLFDPFELITNEKKRIQISVLAEKIQDLKIEFNEKFKAHVREKNEEISKIEEKNERIQEILRELCIQETLVIPILSDDEVPERTITVSDNEVTVERFITPEEQKRILEKQRQDEERMRLQAEDDSKQRAIMVMMGGKLEDRSEKEEKVDIVKPDWMNKPKEDLSEDEKKLIKEFEKKVATIKEEEEKKKKALETELRKLQVFIVDISAYFDQKMSEFFKLKLSTEHEILKTTLTIIKLVQSIIETEKDDVEEQRLNKKLDELKKQKVELAKEMPEIKKELETHKEDYDAALKRDKDIDRLFKRDFKGFDFQFEAIQKLYKKRDVISDSKKGDINHSPFAALESTLSSYDANPAPLNIEQDLPDGMNNEIWIKLVEIRDRKIASEREVKASLRKYSEMQAIAQTIVEDSESVKANLERVSNELNQFIESKFRSTYNLEHVFELKQGQNEFPQAAVVTDYSDAILLHRNQIIKINESIKVLGGLKVDALKGMKEYRKGIHALEWENKLLDFQAEDVVLRNRDIQLLRVTKQMQEYLRGGDEYKQASDILTLERRAEYSERTHAFKIDESEKALSKVFHKISKKKLENKKLDEQLEVLARSVMDRSSIYEVQEKYHANKVLDKNQTKEIFTRRRLVDLAKSQTQDIAILREEVQRLRLRTFPAFQSNE